MKKLSVIMMACLMALGMTQCKKETTPTTQENGVKITLKVGNTSNTRVDVNPNYNDIYAKVNFEVGDIVYVGYNNTKVGELTCQSIGSDPNINVDATFEGTVNIDSYDGTSPLHFYLLGGKGFSPVFDGNTATVNISDQSDKYPVVSYAVSNEPFTGAGSYSTKMMNKCSILKFNVKKPTNANDAICIEGMNNLVTVSFNPTSNDDDGFSYSQTDYGRIKMKGVTSTTDTDPVAMWVIVLPQNALETTGNAYNVGKTCAGVRPTLDAIESNKYLKQGVPMNLYDLSYTVSGEKKVYFAPGNLQYQPSTQTWRFAENQWDYVGDASNGTVYEGGVKCNNANISNASYSGWLDLFGWGTWTTGNIITSNPNQPIDPIQYAQAEEKYPWGGGDFGRTLNGRNDWETLTSSEWTYLFSTRTTSTVNGTNNAIYAKAIVNGVKGLILFPDHYAHPAGVTQPANINTANAAYSSNNYEAAQWAEMELFGATFLPAAGYRLRTTVTVLYNSDQYGDYWHHSATNSGNLLIAPTIVNTNATYLKYYGLSVRLVHPRD